MKLNEMMGNSVYTDRDIEPIKAELEKNLMLALSRRPQPEVVNIVMQLVMVEKDRAYQEGYEDGKYHKD